MATGMQAAGYGSAHDNAGGCAIAAFFALRLGMPAISILAPV